MLFIVFSGYTDALTDSPIWTDTPDHAQTASLAPWRRHKMRADPQQLLLEAVEASYHSVF